MEIMGLTIFRAGRTCKVTTPPRERCSFGYPQDQTTKAALGSNTSKSPSPNDASRCDDPFFTDKFSYGGSCLQL